MSYSEIKPIIPLEGEIFIEYRERYISNLGRVFSTSWKEIKPTFRKCKNRFVLYFRNKPEEENLSHIIYKIFCDSLKSQSKNKFHILYLDGDISNHRFDNLSWRGYNSQELTNLDLVSKLPNEELKPYNNYLLSNFGRVFNWRGEQVCKTRNGKNKYLVILCNGRRELLHRAIYKAFVAEIPENYEINHIDGNPLNNHIKNLEAITHAENCQHAQNIGLNNKGKSKLSDETICRIFELIYNGLTDLEISRRLGVNKDHINRLRKGTLKSKNLLGQQKDLTYYSPKFPKEKVYQILYDIYEENLSDMEISQKYDMAKAYVWQIRSGKKWKRPNFKKIREEVKSKFNE